MTYTDRRDRTINMWNLGFPEIVIIFIVALVIFGPRKLPELGRSLGRGLSEFKRASNELKRTWEDEVEAVKHEVDVGQDELKKIQTDLE
ncbi:MAG: twin-arginine translocase TatA/TatE family subunit [Acidobacteriota bacterium]